MLKFSTNIEKKGRSVATLKDFKGLDTVHSPMNLTYAHAIGMRNLINRDGANRKRKGWRQTDFSFPKEAIPAGTWSGDVEFIDVEEQKKVFLHFYYVRNESTADKYYLKAKGFIYENNNYTEIPNVWDDIGYEQVLTEKLGIVYFENTLIVATGETLLVGDFRYINNQYVFRISPLNIDNLSSPYLPTVYQDNIKKVEYGTEISSVEELAERVAISSYYFDYQYPTQEDQYYNVNDTSLDSNIPEMFLTSEKIRKENILNKKEKSKIVMTLTEEILNKIGSNEAILSVTYIPSLKGYNCTISDSQTNDPETLNYINERDLYYRSIDIELYINGISYQDFADLPFSFSRKYSVEKESKFVSDVYVATADMGTSSDDERYVVAAGKIIAIDWAHFLSFLSTNYGVNFKAGDEISLIFEYERRGFDLSQFNPSFVTLFGADGNPNRLLISDGSSTIYYSEYREPLYIGSENTITLGSMPISGWIKGTETSLYVFKKFSRQEENLYVIDGELVTSEDNQYNVNEGEVVFRNKGYTLPESSVGFDSVCSLANDVLIVSDDGVYGIEMSANVASTERFARSRAEQIKNELQRHDLSKTKCIVWDNKMFLAVDDVVFVADAKFRVSFDGDMSDTFNYEWWMWDHCPVKYWVIVNEKLCFVTDDNRICEFYDGFADYIFDNASVAVIDEQGITLSSEFSKYNKIQFANAYKALIGSETISAIGNSFLVVTSVEGFFEGQEVYFDMETGFATNYPFTIGTKYIVSEIDVDNKYIHFVTEDQTALAFTSGMNSFLATNKFRISQSATGIYNFAMSDEEENNVTVYDADGNKIQFISYNGEENYTAKVFQWKPVIAEWQTGSYDFGTPLYAKTIEKVSIAFDRFSPKALKLYYNTANRGKQNLIQALQQAGNIDVSSISNASLINKLKNANVNNLVDRLKNQTDFDLDALSFVLFTFDQKFETSFTRSFLVRNFNYISFMLISDEEEDFSVNSISFIYKINRSNRGEI